MTSAPPTASRVLSLLAAFVATSVVAGVLLSGLFMPAVGATGAVANNSVEFFESLPTELRQDPLSEKSVLLDATGQQIANFYEENRIAVKLDEIAPVMRDAIVAIEDSRFYQHGGVDPRGLFRAALTNLAAGSTQQGASTLTQQYVKNVLVERAVVKGDEAAADAAVEKSNKRKVQEIKLAISVEKELTKDEILNRYLNIAYFGHQVYGVEAASRYYFGKSAKDLSLPEAATLAGTVQLPAKWDPEEKKEQATARRDVVLKRMFEVNMIDQAEYEAARATALTVKITKPKRGCVNAGSNGFYCDYVQNLIIKDKAFAALGATEEERRQSLLRGGLTIQTTMDPKIQGAAWSAVKDTIPTDDRSGVATAAVTVEPGSGKVLAIAQNKLYDPNGPKGTTATNYATDFEFGGSGGFQTGSTFKPFTLATWLKKGKSLNASVSAVGGSAPFSDFKSCGKRLRSTTPYKYSNAEGQGSGSMTVLNATFNSVNTAYVSMEKQLDLCDIAQTAESMGVHLASAQDDECTQGQQPKTQKIPTCLPSLTLGPKELSPMTMSAAFATFASGGTFCKPLAVASIKDRNGAPLGVPKADCKQVLDKDVANGVNYALQKVLTEGTAAGLGINRPAAGKTGTTNGSVDTWFVGYSAQRATAVWVGDPIPSQKSGLRSTLNGRNIGGVKKARVYGASFAAPIWQKIMKKAHDGLPKKGFNNPDAKYLRSDKARVPDVRGRSVQDATAVLEAAGFRVRVGGIIDSGVPAGNVAGTSPEAGSSLDKGAEVGLAVSNGRGGGAGRGGGRGNDGGVDDLRELFPGFREP